MSIDSSHIKKAHSILNKGNFLGCLENREWNPACDSCCQHGSPILNVEVRFYKKLIKTKTIPSDIVIYVTNDGSGTIKNCVNPDKTCRLGDLKTLFCKMYPLVSGEGRSGGRIKIVDKKCHKCPGKDQPDPQFETKVKKAFSLLNN